MRKSSEKTEDGRDGDKQHRSNDFADAGLLFQQFTNSVSDGIILYGPDMRYRVWNPFMEKLSGKSADEVLGKHPLEAFPHLKGAGVVDAIESVLQGGPAVTIEHQYHDFKHETTGWVSDMSSPLQNNDGEVIGAIGIVREITDKKKLEEELRLSEEGFREAQRLARIGSWELDLVDNKLNWSDEIYKIFEIDPKEFGASYESFLEAIHPDDREAVNKAYTESLTERKPYQIAHRLKMNDGRIKHVHERCNTFYDSGGKAIRSIGTVQDLTELVEVETKLEKSRHFSMSITDLVPNLIYIYDLVERRNVYANRETLSFLGYTPEQIQDMGSEFMERVMHPDDLMRIAEHHDGFAYDNENKIHEIEYRMKDGKGKWRWIKGRERLFSRDKNGKAKEILGIAEDITDRRKIEERLLIISKAVEAASDAIGISDAQGHHFYQNRALSELFEYESAEELEAAGGGATVVKDAEVAREMFGNLFNGKSWSGDLEMETKSGRVFSAYERADAIKDEEGNIVGLIGVITDITDRKRAEQIAQARIRINEFATSTLDELMKKTLDEAELLTGSKIGFFHFLEADQKTLWLKVWSTNTEEKMCSAGGKDSRYDLDKAGVWVDCVHQRRPVIHNDYASLPGRKGLPPGHAPVIRELLIPVFRNDQIVAILGVGNKDTDYSEKDVEDVLQFASLSFDIIQRKQIEEALKESERHFRAIFNQAAVGVAVVESRTGRLVRINNRYSEITGYSSSEIINMKFQDITHPEDIPHSENSIQQLVEGKTREYSLQKRYFHRNGSVVWVNLSVSPLWEKGEEPGFHVAIVEDITERKKAEDALLKSEAVLKEAQRVGKIGSWDWDANTDKITWSAECYRICGYDPDQQPPGYEDHLKIYTPESAARLDEAVKISEQTGHPYELDLERALPGGEKMWVTARSEIKRDSNGNITGLCGTVQDITERKKAEEALLKSEMRFRLMINNSPVPMALNDDRQTVTFVNAAFVKTFGYTLEDIPTLAHWWTKAYPDKEYRKWVVDTWQSELDKVESNGAVFSPIEVNVRCKNGTAKTVLASSALLSSISGSDHIALLYDITEKKKAEDAHIRYLEQDKMATIGRVAGKMAHDFNNVLGIIMGTSELLRTEALAQEVREEIDIIMESARKGRDLTRNLLTFAKDQEAKLTEFDLNERVDLVVRSLKSDLKGIALNTSYGPGAENMIADAGLLEIALINMIQNSIHAVSKTENPCLGVKTYAENNNICIEIADNGCGIPPEWREKIFDPTITLKGSGDRIGAYRGDIKGSGYGMTNVKRCVDKHGGTIKFESEVNKGTTFKISIPRIRGHFSKEEMEIIHKQNVVMEGKRILIVEDEHHFGRILYSLLKKFNHIIDLAADGGMALEHLERNNYDVVSLDFILPDMTGIDVYKKIRETNTEVPIIFVSGNFEFIQSMIDLKKSDPKVDHLTKPFSNVEYVNKINYWLSSGSLTGK